MKRLIMCYTVIMRSSWVDTAMRKFSEWLKRTRAYRNMNKEERISRWAAFIDIRICCSSFCMGMCKYGIRGAGSELTESDN